jgi:ubiquinol-cytochrome c reductase cytochrome b subunit
MGATAVRTNEREQSLTGRLADRVAHSKAGRRSARVIERMRRREVTLHWSNVFGVVAIASFVVIVVSGVVLTFFYVPSGDTVEYAGPYPPLHGQEVSKAFDSTMRISLEVSGGLLIRQAHHWAALLMPAAIMAQLLVTFFTGAFRRPRRGAWVLLFLVLIAALAGGWSGYAMPDDMLSGTGLRIFEGIVLGVPIVGTWAKQLIFGGEFPGLIIENLYWFHLVIVPLLLLALIVMRAWVLARIEHPPVPAPTRSGRADLVAPLPRAAMQAGGIAVITTAVLVLISATVTVNPIWSYGPASPGNATAGSQPDWYTGFLDGALRLVPPGWEFVAFERTWAVALLAPLAVVTLFLLLVVAYPFIEEWITADRSEHHVLERPRNTPTRTAIGVAGIVFYGVLWAAGGADLIAVAFGLTIEGVVLTLQAVLLIGPALAFSLTRRVCLGLQERDRELVLHGFETGRIIRLPGGEYVEVHQQLSGPERQRLLTAAAPAPLPPGAVTRTGRMPVPARVRAAFSRFLFEDRLVPQREEGASIDANR